jgi:hypothetical protein
MKRPAPWWLGWLLLGGLVALFVGERVLAESGWARAAVSGLGALAVASTAGWRILAWRAADAEARRVEGALALAYAGCALALLIYLVSSDVGERLGIGFPDGESGARLRTLLQVLWLLLLGLSLLPALGAQLALGRHRRADEGAVRVEAIRVLEMTGSGLVVALAAAALLLFGYVTSARDKTLDLSYFKTATPGDATTAMLVGADEPIRVVLFFPEVNPVKDEVLGYFRRLADETGRIELEERDRLASPALAQQHQVTEDGTILFVRGERTERIVIGAEMARARATLRGLDRRVQGTLMPMLRGRPVVYLTTGHGELSDSAAAGPTIARRPGEVRALRELLGYLGYEALDLGLVGGLGRDVPADASVVMVLGPQRPFLTEEMEALERYLDRGGSLALALDPEGAFAMGPLERRLGVRYVAEPLADEAMHLQQRGDDSDRRLLVTDQFSSHAAVTTLARAGAGAGVLMVGPGRLEGVEDAPLTPLFIVRSAASTFADADGDYQFDEGGERRDAYNLVAAIGGGPASAELPPSMGGGAAPPPGATAAAGADSTDPAATGADSATASAPPRPPRALVFASSSVFSDPVLVSIGPNAALVADAVKWLAREEAVAGATESEEDTPVVHTRGQDAALFYAAILGGPLLMLGGGLAGVYRRRRARGEAS